MKLMTRHEVAVRLGIAIRTVDRRLADGEIECYHLGDGPKAPVRISEEQLADYVERHSTRTTSMAGHTAKSILDR